MPKPALTRIIKQESVSEAHRNVSIKLHKLIKKSFFHWILTTLKLQLAWKCGFSVELFFASDSLQWRRGFTPCLRRADKIQESWSSRPGLLRLVTPNHVGEKKPEWLLGSLEASILCASYQPSGLQKTHICVSYSPISSQFFWNAPNSTLK